MHTGGGRIDESMVDVSVAASSPGGARVAEAARRLGVSVSTLHSWERRYGLAPSGRTSGGHRRYTAADIAALQQLRRLTASGLATGAAAQAVAAPVLRPPSGTDPATRFAAAADTLDPVAARRLAERAVTRLGPVAAWFEVLAPTLRELGERWARTGTCVEREHLATDAAQEALTGYVRRHVPPARRPALLAVAAPGEAHVLPLHALAAALAAHAVTSLVLTDLPPRALRAAIDGLTPAVLVLWAHAPGTADTRLLRNLALEVPAAYPAGPGWAARRPGDPLAPLTDLPAAVSVVRAWTGWSQ